VERHGERRPAAGDAGDRLGSQPTERSGATKSAGSPEEIAAGELHEEFNDRLPWSSRPQ
jgi:hypothetical protein